MFWEITKILAFFGTLSKGSEKAPFYFVFFPHCTSPRFRVSYSMYLNIGCNYIVVLSVLDRRLLTKFGIFPRGSPECAGSGENPFLLGQPVFADLFGAAATFCREVAVFDPTFAVGRRIAGRKFPLRAVSAFSDKRLCSYLCRAAVGRRIDGRRCFPQFMEKEIWFYITISSWSAAVMPAARRLRRQRGSAPARCS